jgi:nucleoside-specific outer membrane channel protein Tsx
MAKSTRIFMIALLVLATGIGTATAAQWSTTSMSLLKGSGYDLTSSEDATIMTLEHASGWKYGDSFLFFDIFQPFDKDTSIYGEWHPRLSFGKMTQKSYAFGPVKDVLLATELNVGYHNRVYLYGLGFDFDIPHFKFFTINVFMRDAVREGNEATWQISPSWNIPFTIGSARFECGGFIDYSGADSDMSESQLIIVPQVLLDVSNFAGAPQNFYVGIEYQYWQNKYGVKDAEDNLVQAMAKWVF